MHPPSKWLAAKCRNNPDHMFVTGAAQNSAKQVCTGCPVRIDCLVEALDNHEQWGVWGGMTERERRALHRRHSKVTSWRTILTAQPTHPEASNP